MSEFEYSPDDFDFGDIDDTDVEPAGQAPQYEEQQYAEQPYYEEQQYDSNEQYYEEQPYYEEQSQQQRTTYDNGNVDKPSFPIMFLLIVTMITVLGFFIFLVLPALDREVNHSVTEVIEKSTEKGYWRDVLRFDSE